jgi:hypothetical protein
MRSSALIEIINRIDEINADESVRRQFRQLVRAVGAEHGVKAVETADRIEFARNLLDARVSRTTIQERLKACYDISREQAYRDIRAALQLCQNSKPFDTRVDENKASDGQSTVLTINEGN